MWNEYESHYIPPTWWQPWTKAPYSFLFFLYLCGAAMRWNTRETAQTSNIGIKNGISPEFIHFRWKNHPKCIQSTQKLWQTANGKCIPAKITPQKFQLKLKSKIVFDLYDYIGTETSDSTRPRCSSNRDLKWNCSNYR